MILKYILPFFGVLLIVFAIMPYTLTIMNLPSSAMFAVGITLLVMCFIGAAYLLNILIQNIKKALDNEI